MENDYDFSSLDIREIYAQRGNADAGAGEDFRPEEIRLLSKLNKKQLGAALPGYFREYGFNYREELLRFFSEGYLEIKTVRKAERLALTEKGERLMRENDALLLTYNGLSQGIVTPEKIAEAQRKERGKDSLVLLTELYERELAERGEDMSLLVDLQKIYRWRKDDAKVGEMQERMDRFMEEFERNRQREMERTAEKIGIPPEELDRIRREAAEEVHADDGWIKELDRKNRERAGIE